MYWSLRGLTRNSPASAGYANVNVAKTYTSAAHPAAKRGAGSASSGGAAATSFAVFAAFADRRSASRAATISLDRGIRRWLGGTSTREVEGQKKKAGHDLENGQPHSRRAGDKPRLFRRVQVERGEQRDHDAFARPDPARQKKEQISH